MHNLISRLTGNEKAHAHSLALRSIGWYIPGSIMFASPAVSADEEPPRMKTVLVCVGSRKRPVSFLCGEGGDRVRMLVAANAVYQGVTVFDSKTIVQMKSEEWSGEFIDVRLRQYP